MIPGLPAPSKRSRLPLLLGSLGAALWLTQPWWRPALLPAPKGRAPVVAVLIEDPWRTETALAAWRRRPEAELWLLGGPSLQEAAAGQLRQRRLPEHSMAAPKRLETGRNTVEQLHALAMALRTQPPRQLVLITDSRHLPRALTVARVLLGPGGTRVQGLASTSTADVLQAKTGRPAPTPPETPWRHMRDLVRAQLWRTPLHMVFILAPTPLAASPVPPAGGGDGLEQLPALPADHRC